ncbi:(deoxy)nucleoside triphosphate pyrophosphohydrolase [Arthrobacter sp. UYEF20]|uniref:(deoxy)nucleoside triphosphate pyrophosphohydrolase n=1 Tax=Arthrobacter sp. UYEF20 TaxID=1756363 RepID=UPI0033909590
MTGLIDVVGGAVLDSLADPGRLLVARRTAPPQFAGMWEFPGGKVESGETAEQALHRELLEELGVNVRLGAELQAASASGWPLNERAAMRVWFAELLDGEPRPLQDHDELRWMDLGNREEVLGLPWIPADLPIVEALLGALQAFHFGSGAVPGAVPVSTGTPAT